MKKQLRKLLRLMGKKLLKTTVNQRDFTIFSNDCYGGEIYRWFDIEYNTPFIGLFLLAPCYIKLLKNPSYYFSLNLEFIDHSSYAEFDSSVGKIGKYPIGKLDDIEVHFIHYHSEEEARLKWTRRIKRINWTNIKVKFSADKDYATEELLSEFHKLSYEQKVSFSKIPYPAIKDNIVVSKYEVNAKALFRNSLLNFDLTEWLDKGSIKTTGMKKEVLGKFLYFSLK